MTHVARSAACATCFFEAGGGGALGCGKLVRLLLSLMYLVRFTSENNEEESMFQWF